MQMHLITPSHITNNSKGRKIPMKLYYSPGACSLSPHIALLEAGLALRSGQGRPPGQEARERRRLSRRSIRRARCRRCCWTVARFVTEGPVIVQMIADQAAAKNLAPARDSAERYKLLEWLNFITTELHKNFSPLFQPVIPDEVKNVLQGPHHGQVQICRQPARRPGLSDGQAVHRRRRLSVRDADLGRPHQVGPLRAAEPDGLQGPRRARARRCRKR